MATLVLGTVGRAIGGPIGGLLGTFLGGAVDRAVLGGGKPREGARLGNLAVQSSAYGEPLPRVYGRVRIAGNLIWTAGIVEAASTSGGGKRSGPRTTSYSYSASFAVALSARPVARVARIWADGKLLRDADGGWLAPVTMRLHPGSADQAVDSLIAAAEGPGGTPAYRGLAYAVFEDLPLADYGNRIPNLTFEVVADETAVDAGQVASDLAAAAGGRVVVATGSLPPIDGFVAARAGAVREPLAQLAELFDLRFLDDGDRLMIRAGPAAVATTIAIDETGSAADGGAAARVDMRAAASSLDDAVAIGFLDPAREYQPGLQRASRRTIATRVRQIDAPIVLEASTARQLAADSLARSAAARSTATLRLPLRRLGLRPGMQIERSDSAGSWAIRRCSFGDFVVELDVERRPLRAASGGPADAGRSHDAGDSAPGETTLAVLDLPPLFDSGSAVPRLWVAGAGAAPGWRRSGVALSADGGESYTAVGEVAAPSVMGTALTALALGSGDRWDRRNTVDVMMLGDKMWPESRSAAAVLAGANLAAIGDEVIQFATVTALGGRSFRLSGLLRGRRGSTVAAHPPGARLVMLDPALLLPVDPPAEAIGRQLRVRATGGGDGAARYVATTLGGAALRPLSPVFLTMRVDGGELLFGWRRRSRAGFAWLDGVDAPLGELREAYHVGLTVAGAPQRLATTERPEWRYDAVAQAADGVRIGSRLRLAVAQSSDVTGPGTSAVADFILA